MRKRSIRRWRRTIALGVLAAGVGERDRLVAGARDVAVALEPADHLVDGRRRELHRARDVGAGHRQAGLVEPEQRLEVLLLGDGHIGHGAIVLGGAPPSQHLLPGGGPRVQHPPPVAGGLTSPARRSTPRCS